MNELTKADLIQIGDEDEPRILDLRVAERLGFSQARDIRKLISRNREELEGFGALRHRGAQPSGGRPVTEYLLNEGQILVLAMKSDATNAVLIRREVITVYQAFRRGEIGGGITQADLAAMLEQFAASQNMRFGALETKIENVTLNLQVIAEGFDPAGSKSLSHRPAVDFLDDYGVKSKGRRGLSIAVSKALLRQAVAENDLTMVRTENVKKNSRWLYHVDLWDRWLKHGGADVIRAHNEALAGQSVMKFTIVPKTAG